MGGRTEISGRLYSKSTCSANKATDEEATDKEVTDEEATHEKATHDMASLFSGLFYSGTRSAISDTPKMPISALVI